jgi:hypothetical protein
MPCMYSTMGAWLSLPCVCADVHLHAFLVKFWMLIQSAAAADHCFCAVCCELQATLQGSANSHAFKTNACSVRLCWQSMHLKAFLLVVTCVGCL